MKKILNITKIIFEGIIDFLSTPWFFGLLPYKLDKKEWYFHKSDRDINPSFPHLHSKENNKVKMDIYNGEIYRNKSIIGYLTDEDFNKLWSDKKFIKDVKEIRETYDYNINDLPPIPKLRDINNK